MLIMEGLKGETEHSAHTGNDENQSVVPDKLEKSYIADAAKAGSCMADPATQTFNVKKLRNTDSSKDFKRLLRISSNEKIVQDSSHDVNLTNVIENNFDAPTSPSSCLVFVSDDTRIEARGMEDGKPEVVELINPNLGHKCHNLTVSHLRKKLAYCPICRIQYSNHKMANMCLSKHGKRQCWLCLDILSSKKEDFYKHCMEFHSISKNGDIVGCPFCGKCFDFRQGLNQHIVKIHFAESISDIDAVASLSPSTLVDIFTGKPRTSSPSEEVYVQQQPLQYPDQRHIHIKESPLSSSGEEKEEIDSFPDENLLYMRDLPYNKASFVQPLSIQSYSSPRMHASYLVASPSQELCKSTSQIHSHDSVHTLHTRPSVIALSNNTQTVEKMSVPPEQPLGGLSATMGCTPEFPLQQELLYEVESNIEVVENASFNIQKYIHLDNNLEYYMKPPCFHRAETNVVKKQEKYDTSSFPSSSDTSSHHFYQYGIRRAPYEKMITRVSTSGVLESTPDIRGNTVEHSMAVVPGHGGSQSESIYSYSAVNAENMSKSNANLEFEEQQFSVPNNEMSFCSLPTPILSPPLLATSECLADRTLPELKLPENCGVKRRILMKAMFEEHQFKKPASISSKSKMSKPALQLQTTVSDPEKRDMVASKKYKQTKEIHPGGVPTIPANKSAQGPAAFFKQYVSQEEYSNPYKLLELTRTPAPHQTDAISLSDMSDANYWNKANNTLSLPVTSSGHSMAYTAASNIITNSRNAVGGLIAHYQLPPVNSRSHSVTANGARGRRPPNPAFWDNIRARLIVSQNMKYRSRYSAIMPRERDQYCYPLSLSACRYSGKPYRSDSVVIQNPFEEDSLLFSEPGKVDSGLAHPMEFLNNSKRAINQLTPKIRTTEFGRHHSSCINSHQTAEYGGMDNLGIVHTPMGEEGQNALIRVPESYKLQPGNDILLTTIDPVAFSNSLFEHITPLHPPEDSI